MVRNKGCVSEQPVYSWFRMKVESWGSTSQERKDYIRQRGRTGLASEFSVDEYFKMNVCPWIRKVGDVQAKLRMPEMVAGLLDWWFGVPGIGEIDIVIGAIADACGYDALGDKLLPIGAVALIIGVLSGLF